MRSICKNGDLVYEQAYIIYTYQVDITPVLGSNQLNYSRRKSHDVKTADFYSKALIS
ncbi:hypothetical protein GGGNBK_05155 [Sporosarcina sp. ANT_H38]